MSQIPSIRLRPTENTFLTTQAFDSGSVFYDSNKNTLVVMDGRFKGGYELLRADLSNISGGGGGSGAVNFGARTLSAQAFVGDGSGLTNLPIPPDVASQSYVDTAISTAFNVVATTSSLGTVKVDGTTITILNGVISAVGGGGGGGGGIELTALSVGTPNTASGDGAISYDNTTGIFKYTPPDLTAFITTYTETSTLDNVVGRNATTNKAITVNNTLTATTVNGTSGTIDTLNSTTLTANTINTSTIINTGTGVPRWTSGSDFIIDAAGDVNVVGSKITNVATPLLPNDAATKQYVDGAASAFNGGTVSGAVNITNNTASSSYTTGALKVAGGVGIGGNLYVNDIIYVWDTNTLTYSPALTSASGGYNGGIIGGTVYVNNSTASTSFTSGALRVRGGVGIQGDLFVGPDANFNGIRFGRGANSGLGSNTNVAIGGGTGNDAPLSTNVSGTNDVAIGFKALSSITNSSNNTAVGYASMGARTAGDHNTAVGSGSLNAGGTGSNTAVGSGAMGAATGDTSTAMGHDALYGAAGSGNIGIGFVAGQLLALGDYNVIIGSNPGDTISGTSNNVLICDGAGNIRISADSTGDVKIISTTGSSSSTTGALTVQGGVGISGAINTGGSLSVTGIIKTVDSTAATSKTTGSLQVSGGAGIAGDCYATNFFGNGANLTGVTATSYSGGTVSGATSFTSNAAATSTTTGAVKVTGGVGVQGAVWAANFNGVVIPAASTSPQANQFIRTDGSRYAYLNYINSDTSAETLTLGNFIVTNATDNFYRKYSQANVKTTLGITPIIGTPASSYGAVAIQGAKNGWSGISFRDASAALCGTLMMTTTSQGIYNAADNNWLLQWDQSGNFTATANVTAYSDERLKTNIQVIPNALDKVMQIDGVTFNRISNGERGTGVLAQQLQKVLPEAVLADKDGMLSVAYGNTVGLLIEAMKEQQAQIEALRAEIAALKGN